MDPFSLCKALRFISEFCMCEIDPNMYNKALCGWAEIGTTVEPQTKLRATPAPGRYYYRPMYRSLGAPNWCKMWTLYLNCSSSPVLHVHKQDTSRIWLEAWTEVWATADRRCDSICCLNIPGLIACYTKTSTFSTGLEQSPGAVRHSSYKCSR